MWQDDSEAKTITKKWVTQVNYDAGNYSDTSGDTATTYCNDLTLGGYDDWRLPTRKELSSLVDYSRFDPAISSIFVNTASSYFWSSTTDARRNNYAWNVYFSVGGISLYDGIKKYSHYVRCVR